MCFRGREKPAPTVTHCVRRRVAEAGRTPKASMRIGFYSKHSVELLEGTLWGSDKVWVTFKTSLALISRIQLNNEKDNPVQKWAEFE